MVRHKPQTPASEPALPDRTVEHFSVPSQLLRQTHSIRLDASYFNPAVAHVLETLRHSGMKLETLGAITSRVFIPPRFKRIYVQPEYGVPFLQGSHVVHFQPADLKYLSRKAHTRLERWIINSGWILITCSGTVGRVAICPPEWDQWAASQHILRIIPNDSACPVGYLYSFLASPLGHVQLTNRIYGAVVDELTEEQARSVLVPLPINEQQRAIVAEIDREAREAVTTRSKASGLLSSAVGAVGHLMKANPS
jgi:type I restriction enzyme, S subunit